MLAMRVASYCFVDVLKPVQASVVNGAPASVPSMVSSMNRPPSSDRIVDVPVLESAGPPRLGPERQRHVPRAHHRFEPRMFRPVLGRCGESDTDEAGDDGGRHDGKARHGWKLISRTTRQEPQFPWRGGRLGGVERNSVARIESVSPVPGPLVSRHVRDIHG